MWPMGKGLYATVCTYAKAGSSAFTQLFFRHATGAFAGHYPVPWIHTDAHAVNFSASELLCESMGGLAASDDNETFWLPDKHSRLVSILIVRDPYERLLSGYLHMVRALARWNWASSTKARALLLLPNATAATATAASFAHFTSQLRHVNASVRLPPWHPFLLQHLLPFTSTWYRVRHACHLRPPQAFDRVYRLEDQARWYPSFLRELSLTNAAQDPGWRTEQGASNGCWWTPPGVACADVLTARPDPTSVAACSAQSAASADSASIGHLNGACAKSAAYYTASAREAAAKFLRDDLAFWAMQPRFSRISGSGRAA